MTAASMRHWKKHQDEISNAVVAGFSCKTEGIKERQGSFHSNATQQVYGGRHSFLRLDGNVIK
jgi:hypothetical protein